MRYHEQALDTPNSVAAGTAQSCKDLQDKTVHVGVPGGGAFTATVEVQGRINQLTWVTIQSVTTAALVSIPQTVEEVRVNVPAYTSGAVAAVLAGFDPNG